MTTLFTHLDTVAMSTSARIYMNASIPNMEQVVKLPKISNWRHEGEQTAVSSFGHRLFRIHDPLETMNRFRSFCISGDRCLEVRAHQMTFFELTVL